MMINFESAPGDDKGLGYQFFVQFSRFDFALKRGGFVLGEPGSPALANWNNFAKALGQEFFDEMQHVAEASVLFSDPPRKLYVTESHCVEFHDQASIRSPQMLFEAIRLVRNNLFHGEKLFMNERDTQLVTACIRALNLALEYAHRTKGCEEVARVYEYARVNRHQ